MSILHDNGTTRQGPRAAGDCRHSRATDIFAELDRGETQRVKANGSRERHAVRYEPPVVVAVLALDLRMRGWPRHEALRLLRRDFAGRRLTTADIANVVDGVFAIELPIFRGWQAPRNGDIP